MNSLLCTTELKMKQISTLFCSYTLFILESWMFNVINSSKMNNLKTIQEFSRRLENIQGQQDVFQESRTKRVLIANSRTILGAQGRLATLLLTAVWYQSVLPLGSVLLTSDCCLFQHQITSIFYVTVSYKLNASTNKPNKARSTLVQSKTEWIIAIHWRSHL